MDRDHRVGPAERDGRTPGEVPAVQTATTVSGRGGMALRPAAGGALQLPVPGAELRVHQWVEPVVAQLELAEAAQPARHQVGPGQSATSSLRHCVAGAGSGLGWAPADRDAGPAPAARPPEAARTRPLGAPSRCSPCLSPRSCVRRRRCCRAHARSFHRERAAGACREPTGSAKRVARSGVWHPRRRSGSTVDPPRVVTRDHPGEPARVVRAERVLAPASPSRTRAEPRRNSTAPRWCSSASANPSEA